jgi:hypothetical protein
VQSYLAFYPLTMSEVPTNTWFSFGHEQTRIILRLDGIDVCEACNTIHVTFRLRCHTQIHNSQHKSNNRTSISTMLSQVQVLSIICGGTRHTRLWMCGIPVQYIGVGQTFLDFLQVIFYTVKSSSQHVVFQV